MLTPVPTHSCLHPVQHVCWLSVPHASACLSELLMDVTWWVMTQSSPSSPSLTQQCRLGFHRPDETKAHAIWLINSVKPTFAIPAQCPVWTLLQSLRITISMTAKSQNIAIISERGSDYHPTIFFSSLYILFQSSRPTCHVVFVVKP